MPKRKICIVQLGLIGDLLLVTPMFRALKLADPGCELHLLAGRRNHMVATGNPDIDRIHVHTKRFWKTLRLLAYFLTTRFDVWIDPKCHKSTESAIFGRIARAPMKIGFRGTRAFTHPAMDEMSGGEQYAVRSLRNLEYLGIHGVSPRPVVPDAAEEEGVFARFRAEHALDRYCAVNISASTPDRDWQQEKWVALVTIITRTGLPCVISCIPAYREIRDAMLACLPRCFAYDAPSIRGIFPLVRNAAIVLTVDTSIVHIAAAYNKPVVVLFGNLKENYTRYWPLSERYRAVMHPQEGAAVGMIGAGEVERAFGELLGEINGRMTEDVLKS